jgi:flagellar assembly protein FliH
LSERTANARTIERWSPPRVEGAPSARSAGRTAAPVDAARAAAERAEAAGYAAGPARAQAEVQARLRTLEEQGRQLTLVLQQLQHPLKVLDEEVERTLLQLALAIGTQLARRALTADPATLIGLIREGLQQLPLGARELKVHMHPKDAAIIRERLAATAAERTWALLDDPTLTRGGCIIESDHSRIDARLESRLQALVASALGDERSAERTLGTPAADAPEPTS